MNDYLFTLVVRGLTLLICLPVHECAHAWMADRLGDPTGRRAGRISLNPFRHLSAVGSVMMLFFGMGYAKPVPVNIGNFPYEKRKKYFALTSLAGPVSNMLMAVVFILISNAFIKGAILRSAVVGYSAVMTVYRILINIAYVNISLAVFNMIPVPPLDGSRLFTAALPDDLYYKLLAKERYIVGILLLIMFVLRRIGFSPISIVTGGIYNGLWNLLAVPFGLN